MTTPHLLLISIGPVQDFIAQARRSRDLWFGSHLLSELSRAAAAALARTDATLIFPAFGNTDPELAPCDTPTRCTTKHPPVAVANKILAEIPPGPDPYTYAEQARAAVHNEWRGIATRVRNAPRCRGLFAADIDDVWNEQVEDVLEFYAVAVPQHGNYDAERRAAEQALAGRKNLRDFRPWQHDRPGTPKSSLDGARVSVLSRDRTAPSFSRLRMAEQEQLDAIGVIKRAGFEPDQFVPLVNIAAGMWLQQAQARCPDPLAEVRNACKDQKIPSVSRRLPVVEPLPFDASVLYPSRWPALFKELPTPGDAAAARTWGEAHVTSLLNRMHGAPTPYVACLVADGDHMGRAIGRLDCAEANRKFSRALADFPSAAREIIEQQHFGALVYAGGDDVLAFLPVATACDCAAALAACFHDIMATVTSADTPTLSVGIAVGHMMEAMSVLLDLGRQAERAAKDADRNALAVIVDKRSGGQRRLALNWNTKPLARLKADAALLAGPLSTGKLHELEALLRRFPDPARTAVPPDAAAALAAYAREALAHSGDGSATATLKDLLDVPDATSAGPAPDYATFRKDLAAAIDRVLVVRTLHEAGFTPS